MLNRVHLRCHQIKSDILVSSQKGFVVFVSHRSLMAFSLSPAWATPILYPTAAAALVTRRMMAAGNDNCSIRLELITSPRTINFTFQPFRLIATATSQNSETNINSVREFTKMTPNKMSDLKDGPDQSRLNGDPECLELHDYNRAISDLNSLQSNSQVLALAKYKKPETILPLFRKQMRLAGIQPEQLNQLNAIHISGTKGKGSTCAFLEGILLHQGRNLINGRPMRVASYNSPHLVHVTERIRLNGQPIARPLFIKYFRHIFDKLKLETQREQVTMPSYFAFLTILAFHIFLEEHVDCAIIEVGIGGEYDPTNVIPVPVACAITTLDLDHTNILGNTIKSIAWTKAGIIKPRVPLFTIEHEQPEAFESINTRAIENESQVLICKPLQADGSEQLGIKGPAQRLNAALACQLARYFLSPERSLVRESPLETNWTGLPESFRKGLNRSCLPGRCQIIRCPDARTFFLDGAHTKKSMDNCLDWFTRASCEMDETATRVLMVNVIGERNKGQVLEPLIKSKHLFDKIIFTSNRIHKATTAKQSTSSSDNFSGLQDSINHERSFENVKNNARVWADLACKRDTDTQVLIKPSIIESLDALDSNKSSHVLITGSLHFVGAIMEALEFKYQNKLHNS